jgi:eukaryotic-like serine/threonine-protein kinase
VLPWGLWCLLRAAIFILTARRNSRIKTQLSSVLADFTNTTGDPVFDGTLRQGLAVQLEQSPFLSIISDDQIKQNL